MAVCCVQEEMMYFKLELINREECYNKIFARSPNVGVMQAIKVRPSLASPSDLSAKT